MGLTKLNIGILGALAIAGGATLILQHNQNARLADDLQAMQQANQEIGSLRAANARLASDAAEVDRLRHDDTELARLKSEVAALRHGIAPVGLAGRKAVAGSAPPGQVYEVSNLDLPPKATFQAAPVYPAALRAAGVAGQAVISFVVGSDGNVHDAKVDSSTHPDFADSALAAVQQWRFDPGQHAGRPVNTRISVPMIYSIGTGDGKSPAKPPAPVSWF